MRETPMKAVLVASLLAATAACAPAPAETIVDAGGEAQACPAERYAYLVGRPRSEIPQTPPGATWRVTCSSCPVTMDYNPNRLNILYDRESGVVEDVKCG